MILKGKKGVFKVTVVVLVVVFVCSAILASGKLSTKAASPKDKKKKVEKLLNVAKEQIGYKEAEDNTTKYGKWYASFANDNEYEKASWSCMFAAWCGANAGLSEAEYGYYAYTGYWVNWFKNNGTYHEKNGYEPEKGDIVFFDRDNNGSTDSVGIVEKNSWGKISVIKGNVNEEVVRVKLSINDDTISGYGTPLYTQNESKYPILEEPILGIDVSKYNKTIDWDQVKNSEAKFAYIRLGYRGYGSGSLVMDKNFITNITEANRVGIDVGIYFVTQAITVQEAIEEADYAISKIQNYNVKYPIAIDTEQASENERSKDLTVDERTVIIKAFCDRIEEKGYKSQIYSGKHWFNTKLDMNQLQGYDIWVAEYTHNVNGQTSFQYNHNIWQYSDKGQISGIEGVVDMNKCYVDYTYEEDDEGFFSKWFN